MSKLLVMILVLTSVLSVSCGDKAAKAKVNDPSSSAIPKPKMK